MTISRAVFFFGHQSCVPDQCAHERRQSRAWNTHSAAVQYLVNGNRGDQSVSCQASTLSAGSLRSHAGAAMSKRALGWLAMWSKLLCHRDWPSRFAGCQGIAKCIPERRGSGPENAHDGVVQYLVGSNQGEWPKVVNMGDEVIHCVPEQESIIQNSGEAPKRPKIGCALPSG